MIWRTQSGSISLHTILGGKEGAEELFAWWLNETGLVYALLDDCSVGVYYKLVSGYLRSEAELFRKAA